MQFSQFEAKILGLCKTHEYSIALPECRDKRILAAACFLLNAGCLRRVYTFLSSAELEASLAREGLSLPTPLRKSFVSVPEAYPSLRQGLLAFLETAQSGKAKPKSFQELQLQADNPLFQAGYLLRQAQVQAVLAGAVATTADVIRAALATVGLAAGGSTLSGAFLLSKAAQAESPEQLYLYADCAVVVQPAVQQLVTIAAEAVQTWQSILGGAVPARVAFLSFSTKGSAQHERVDHMRKASELFRQSFPSVLVDGELQFDAAIDAQVAQRKAPHSPVAGRANIFIFPDLNSANIAYKITERLAGFQAYGPLLQGLALPYSDLSRGAQVKDIIISACLNLLKSCHGP